MRLHVKRGKAIIGKWGNSEVKIQIKEPVKDKTCFVIASAGEDHDKSHMIAKGIIRACKESKAKEIIVLLTYMGYSKMEKKKDGRVPIMAKLVAQELCLAGAHHIVMIDLHADGIEGLFDVPVDHLRTTRLFIERLKKDGWIIPGKTTGVSTDAGGVSRVSKFIRAIGAYLAIIFKHRPTPEEAKITAVIGKDKISKNNCIIIDDLIQSAGSIFTCVMKLIECGAEKIIICITHSDFCGEAYENMRLLMKSKVVDAFYITDTAPIPKRILELPNVFVVTVSDLLAEVIKKIYMGESLSGLYEVEKVENHDIDARETKKEILKKVMEKYKKIDEGEFEQLLVA